MVWLLHKLLQWQQSRHASPFVEYVPTPRDFRKAYKRVYGYKPILGYYDSGWWVHGFRFTCNQRGALLVKIISPDTWFPVADKYSLAEIAKKGWLLDRSES